jgi:hypothetical protein
VSEAVRDVVVYDAILRGSRVLLLASFPARRPETTTGTAALVRLAPDGRLDPSFGRRGFATTQLHAATPNLLPALADAPRSGAVSPAPGEAGRS